jgi:hypothetical protein
MNRIKLAATAIIGGLAVAVAIALPAAADAYVSVQNTGGDRNVLIRGVFYDNSRYVTLTTGQRAQAYYAPRKVWVPTGCLVWKDSGPLFADDADGSGGFWKTFSYQTSEVDFRITCP